MDELEVQSKINDIDLHSNKAINKPLVRQGLPYKNRSVDSDIWHWRNALIKLRGRKQVTKSEVQNYARQVYIKAGISNFQASDGWYRRWLSRWTSIGLDSNDKMNGIDVKTVPLSKLENKETTLLNKNKLKSYKTKSYLKHKTEIEKQTVHNMDTVSEENLKQPVQVCNEIISTEVVNKEKEKNVCNSVSGNMSILHRGDYSLTNTRIEKEYKNINYNVEHTTSQTIISPVLQSPGTTLQKNIFNDSILSPDSSSIDDFLYSSILYNSNEICHKEYEDLISRNSNFKRNKTTNFINSEMFFSDNVINEKCNMLMSNSTEKTDLKIKEGKVISNCKYKDIHVNKVLKKGERYLPHFKSKVVTFAAASTIKLAAVKFNVNRGTVSDWLKEKERSADGKITVRPLPLVENQEAADLLFVKWIEIHLDNLSRQLILKKTLELFDEYSEDVLQKTCPWFVAYIKRLNDKKFDQKLCSRKYIIYPENFKVQVVRYAQKFSQIAAARLFVIARKRVFEWLSKVKSTGTIKAKCPVNPSSYVTDSVIDNQIWTWYKEQSVTPSSKQVREKGRQLYKSAGYTMICSHGWYYRWRSRLGLPTASSDNSTHDSLLLEWILTKLDKNQNISHNDILSAASKLKKSSGRSQFKPSSGWALRFCKRYPELLQTIPGVSTKLPTLMESKVEQFKNNLLSCIKDGNIVLENIISMDEIALHFLLTGNNKRKLLVRKPGFDTCQATLVISGTANGTLLPFMLILKGAASSIPEWRGPNSFVIVSEKGCMDVDIMLLWLQRVCFAKIDGNGTLISDCFEHHTCPEAVEQLSLHNIKHFVIPGGCSSRLQPLNLASQRLKSKVEQYWAESLPKECWTDGTSRLKPPSHTQIITWVQKWYSCFILEEKESIKNTFQQIYFSPDGFSSVTEQNELFAA